MSRGLDDPYRSRIEPVVDGDPEAARVVERELELGERLSWAGRPVQGLRLTAHDALMIPFSLLWGGFAIVWEVLVNVMGAPLLFRLWGIPFVLVGLHLMVGRFFTDARRRARTWYGVTDRRAVFVVGAGSRKTTSLDLLGVEQLELTERADGRGDVVFGRALDRALRKRPAAERFEGIASARAVHTRIREAQRALRAANE